MNFNGTDGLGNHMVWYKLVPPGQRKDYFIYNYLCYEKSTSAVIITKGGNEATEFK